MNTKQIKQFQDSMKSWHENCNGAYNTAKTYWKKRREYERYTLRRILNEEDIIRVPESIKIYGTVLCESLSIGNGEQGLGYDDCDNWTVFTLNEYPLIEGLKLIPIKQEDLKPGDVLYNGPLQELDFLTNYCVWCGEKFVCWTGGVTEFDEFSDDPIYKVTKI